MYAVKGSTQARYLRALERRLAARPEAEFATALGRSTASRDSAWRTRISIAHQFASGWKRNYYGKGDVIVYRLNRDGRRRPDESRIRRQRH